MAIIKEFLKAFLFVFLTVGLLEVVCTAPIPGTMPRAEAVEQWQLTVLIAILLGIIGGVVAVLDR